MSAPRIIFCLLLICGLHSVCTSQIVINEVMASNITAQLTPDKSDFADWIELYNAGNTIINTGEIFITDDLSNPFKWQPYDHVDLYPGNHYYIWADGLDYENHASFKLSGSGEQIGIFYADGRISDTVTLGVQWNDVSFGRYPDGGGEWQYFAFPSYEQPNASPGLYSSEQVQPPQISPEGGLFSGNQLITMASGGGSTIRYTLDGSIPTAESQEYSGPININETTVIRARGFQEQILPSDVVTSSYVINETSTFPVISIATPPEFLFDEKIGITVGICVSDEPGASPPFDWTANYWNRWERPVHIEYYAPEGVQGFAQDAGIAIFGGFLGRQLRQKAFTLYARDKYGDSDFDFPLFPSKPINSYRRFILRCSSNDFNRTFIRDAMMQTLAIGQMDVDYQAYQPAFVYLNGDFWGMYNIREKTNHFYPEHNYGIDADSVDLVEGIDHTAHGDGGSYLDLIDFVLNNDMTIPANLEYVQTQMDVVEFMNYYITEIYVCNHDWLHQNIKCWREHSDKGKWRWLLYDLDWGFNGEGPWITEAYNDPTIQWILDQGQASTLFQRLGENDKFRAEFVQRFVTHLNLTFNPERVHHIIQTMADRIAPELPRQIERWGALQSMEYWIGEVDILHTFADRRLPALSTQLDDIMMPEGKSELILEVSNEDAGWISVFDVPCPPPIFGAPWYNNIPIRIQAHAEAGWQFVRWIGSHESEEETIMITLQDNAVLHAQFERYDLPSVMISEIHYNPSTELQGADDDFEFLELFNNEDEQIDISGYRFTEGIDFSFPPGSFMDAGECVILAKNPEMYTNEGIQVYRVATGRLDNAGEMLCLRDSLNVVVDQVHFDDHYPWPREADGEGPSLELQGPWLDNGLASSWKASVQAGGTPGSGIRLGVEDMEPLPDDNLLLDVRPNPFRLTTHIRYSLTEEGSIILRIFNSNGQEVGTLTGEKQPPGFHEISWVPDNLPTGIYFINGFTGGNSQSVKVLYLNQD